MLISVISKFNCTVLLFFFVAWLRAEIKIIIISDSNPVNKVHAM